MEKHRETAIVVGGSSGVGLATVRRLAARGVRVIAVGRDAAKLEKALDGLPGYVSAATADASDRAALESLFAGIGQFDHLINTLSGGEGGGAFAELPLSALRRGFEAKLWPHLETLQAAQPHLAPGGSVTLVTAISARIANPGTSGLAAINGALESMIGALARELAPARVNAVSPGVIDTPWWDDKPAAFKQGLFETQAATLPAGRVGQPDDVAQVIDMLTVNSFVTGTVIPCDGGLHLL
jgi:NAD(P)-dependent dehydrogenase (short-subunit alcohol dehydrogenase family)